MWVIIVLLSMIAVLTLIISIPVELAFDVAMPGRPCTRIKLLWFFGLVGKEMGRKEKAEEEVSPEKPRIKKKKPRFKDIFALLHTKGLLKHFLIFIRDLLRCFQIRDLSADIRMGLGSPDYTGMLFALIGPSVFWPASTSAFNVNVQPAFEDEFTFEGHARGKVRLRPIRLLIPLIKFIFSMATFRLLRNFIASRWKRKKK